MHYSYDVALSFASEEKALVERAYHYLKAAGLRVFFAPSPECQSILSSENQREIFYRIFGLEAEYVALFVSRNYINREVPMEEANIAFSRQDSVGKVIPVYLDGTPLPKTMLDPNSINYFRSDNAAAIVTHITAKIKAKSNLQKAGSMFSQGNNVMNADNNKATNQFFIQNFNGDLKHDSK